MAALPPPGDQGALGQQRSQLLKESRDVSMQVRLVLIRKCQGDMFVASGVSQSGQQLGELRGKVARAAQGQLTCHCRATHCTAQEGAVGQQLAELRGEVEALQRQRQQAADTLRRIDSSKHQRLMVRLGSLRYAGGRHIAPAFSLLCAGLICTQHSPTEANAH